MTQIQEKSIPSILNGRDCFIKSQTGSGKTLAYAIPIIQSLQSREPRLKRSDGIRALVLVPTRELATQTCQVFEQLCNVIFNLFNLFDSSSNGSKVRKKERKVNNSIGT